ncbi:hypothetical protein GCM10007913_11660 [Devosia yakushimensis]|uniref:Uncharacterized protein n=1 Tax=Devosia yakushimensis TaxID=470028 RepID=A0ABQ5UDI3_9HYPH|nr:hypothetical protein [Devosia yakushimensis]GLQ09234.1 hypothetical protein GCM10007913_11660 [Devosia yakushimensis]
MTNVIQDIAVSFEAVLIVLTNGATFRTPTPRPLYDASIHDWNDWRLLDEGREVEWPKLGVVIRVPQPEEQLPITCTICGGNLGDQYTHPTCTCSRGGTATASFSSPLSRAAGTPHRSILPPHPDNFADHPETIGERRATAKSSAAAWSPRDVLIELLREIDSGRIRPKAIVVSISATGADGSLEHHYRNACPDTFTALGLLARAEYKLQRE